MSVAKVRLRTSPEICMMPSSVLTEIRDGDGIEDVVGVFNVKAAVVGQNKKCMDVELKSHRYYLL